MINRGKRVIDVVKSIAIRRCHHCDGIGIREIARSIGLSSNTVLKYLASGIVETIFQT
jgi:DNA-binding transcriptional regulator LsrR (DeoR family)